VYVDAFATYFLEADASGQPDPEGENVFQISPKQPNQMVVLDFEALPCCVSRHSGARPLQ
jgi:hypothetical protein